MKNAKKEKRRARRHFIYCPLFDDDNNFLGYIIDFTKLGIKASINMSEINTKDLFVKMVAYDGNELIPVKAHINIIWKKKKSDNIVEIGAEIVSVDDDKNLEKFYNHCVCVSETYFSYRNK